MRPWATGAVLVLQVGSAGSPSSPALHQPPAMRFWASGRRAPISIKHPPADQTCSSSHQTCRVVLSNKGGVFSF